MPNLKNTTDAQTVNTSCNVYDAMANLAAIVSSKFYVIVLCTILLTRTLYSRKGEGDKGVTESPGRIKISTRGLMQSTSAAQRETQKAAEGPVATEGEREEHGEQCIPSVAGSQLVYHHRFQHGFGNRL